MRAFVHASPERESRSPDTPVPPPGSPERLSWLVRRISGDDHHAFAELFDEVSGPLRDRLRTRLSSPPRAAAIVTATFVEVWWLAGCHPEADVLGWIQRIVDRRVEEGRPPVAVPVLSADLARLTPSVLAAMRSAGAELELAVLLGRPVTR